MRGVTFDDVMGQPSKGLPSEGSTVEHPDAGNKIAVVQFKDGLEIITPVQTEAEAKAVVMKAFKNYGNKVRGGYCATRDEN